MRAYFTTTVDECKRIWREGFRDLHQFADRCGVWFASQPLDANDGFVGDVTICMELSDDEIAEFEVDDPLHPYREFLIPAEILNRIGKPAVYDHDFSGASRRDLVKSAERWNEAGVSQQVDNIRDAIAFFDDIGWMTPLKLKEECD